MVSWCPPNQKRWVEEWSLFRVSYLTSQPRGTNVFRVSVNVLEALEFTEYKYCSKCLSNEQGHNILCSPWYLFSSKYGLQGFLLELSPKHGWIGETLSSNMAHRVSQMLSITLSHNSVLVNVVSFLD